MLTELQEKLAEAHALAIAAAVVTAKVAAVTPDHELELELHTLRADADETRARCRALERRFEPELGDALLAHVNTTKEKAADLVNAVWSALEILAAKAEDEAVLELAVWALPIQRAHLDTAFSGAVRLAELRNPNGARWG